MRQHFKKTLNNLKQILLNPATRELLGQVIQLLSIIVTLLKLFLWD
ncbi:hypothetical protein [Gloeothece verrucosa]|uniref:Uncharacterized protein n=1 Tax=Gloeothece verrucosa (strain PCC 7822) TaxID=497965 RepID=E0UIN9_GLOV7|nr:hypothetical protein [Gloeothece verrucosa]ADN13348.1 hypothetical protein Cyan7822_1347 [Gloeothece verrucosa PCC 7822]